ncbi:MAG: DUF1285 domain-containing protein [Smithellaceae bacterium]
MDQSDIKIDKDGIWYYRGAHMFRKDILSLFFEHLKIDESGRYYIELNEETYYVDVEDTAFVVSAVFKTKQEGENPEKIDVLLSDDCMETLDLNTISVGKDNVLYCRIKGGVFPARFTRSSYYQLAEFIEPDDENGTFFIPMNNEKYFIRNNQSF